MYTRAVGCEHCRLAKEMANQRGLEFTEYVVGENLSRDEVVSEVKRRSGVLFNTVPVVFVDDELIGGRAEFKKWLEEYDSKQELKGVNDLDMDDLDI